jgi:hypothetical protein
MRIINFLLLCFGGIVRSRNLEEFSGRIIGSINYGNSYYSKSGVELKRSSGGYSYIGYGPKHESVSIHGSGSNHGSGSSYGSSNIHGSGSKTSNHKYMSTYLFSVKGYGSQGYGSQGSGSHGSGSHGSGSQGSGSHGSGSHGSGSSKYRHSGSYHGLFSPTMEPTEELPPIHHPPNPTYRPTSTMKIPNIPITFKTSDDITVPNMHLTFQIKQGANGWSSYPDSPPLKTAVSTILGLDEKYITNMQIKTNMRRLLLSSFEFSYNITTPPISTDPVIVKLTYYNISYKLKSAVSKGVFTDYLRKQGYAINVTTIEISEYNLVNQPETNAIESAGAASETSISYYIYVSIISVTLAGLLAGGCYFIYKRRLTNKIDTEARCVDSIPNPIHR